MKTLDPARMSAADRVAELGELLAAGIQRLLAREGKPLPAANQPQNQRDRLDVLGKVEAQCAAPAEVPA